MGGRWWPTFIVTVRGLLRYQKHSALVSQHGLDVRTTLNLNDVVEVVVERQEQPGVAIARFEFRLADYLAAQESKQEGEAHGNRDL